MTPSVMTSLCAAGIGYLLGSFPSAYILVRWRSRVDIRTAGSGNVGTYNSYDVTGSKMVGITVLMLDALKGALAVLISRWICGDAFSLQGLAAIAAVLGHNFPVWLGFKGGRGLAPAAGSMLVLGWPVVAVWLLLWWIGNKTFKDINMGNVVATGGLLVLILFSPGPALDFAMTAEAPIADIRLFGVGMMCAILLKLIQPLREYLAARRGVGQQ